MEIKTNFDIGDEYWMPRVRYEYIVETKLFDELEYERRTSKLVPYAKKKRIFSIDIEIEVEQTKVIYWCEDVIEHDEKSLLDGYNTSRICSEKDFVFKTKDEALKFAQNWAMTEKTEYFGETL